MKLSCRVWSFAALVLVISAIVERSEASPYCYHGGSDPVQFTQYWIPKEGSHDVDDDGNVLSLTGPQTKSIVQDDGTLIERTDENTYNKCAEEGTCILLNGDLVNLASSASTFQVLDRSKFPYGQGSSGKPLVPFVSVAANDLHIGTTLMVKELRNLQLPNGQRHNGCVRVDDMGVDLSCHIDWFVKSYANEVQLSNLPEHVTVHVRRCKILSYSG